MQIDPGRRLCPPPPPPLSPPLPLAPPPPGGGHLKALLCAMSVPQRGPCWRLCTALLPHGEQYRSVLYKPLVPLKLCMTAARSRTLSLMDGGGVCDVDCFVCRSCAFLCHKLRAEKKIELFCHATCIQNHLHTAYSQKESAGA